MARPYARSLAVSASILSMGRVACFALTDSAWPASAALCRGRTARVPICVIIDEEHGPDRFLARGRNEERTAGPHRQFSSILGGVSFEPGVSFEFKFKEILRRGRSAGYRRRQGEQPGAGFPVHRRGGGEGSPSDLPTLPAQDDDGDVEQVDGSAQPGAQRIGRAHV